MDEQQKFDFTRADQLGLLTDVVIPKQAREVPRHKVVSPLLAKAVLIAIDKAGRSCWLSQKTMAERVNCSVRSIVNAIARLMELGLVTKVRGTTNEHRIVWTEVEQLVRVQQQEQQRCQGRDQSTGIDHVASRQGDMQPVEKVQMTAEKVQTLHVNSKNYKEQPPTERAKAAGGGCFWFGLELQRIGLNRWRALSIEFADRPESELREAIAVYEANRTKFHGPAALVDFLRSGSWPVDGVMTCEQQAEYRTRQRRPAMSEEDQFIFGYRAHLRDRGMRGDELIAAVERGLARWRADHAKPE